MRIEKVAVIGAGNMGSGIAQKIAQEGIEVILVDMKDEYVLRGREMIEKILAEAVERRIFTQEKIEGILRNISGTTKFEDVRDVDLVIEAIFEDFDAKVKLFQKLDNICQEKTVFASNTSSFSITEMGNTLERKDRFLGLHFFYHPAKNRLLEVIPGKHTSAKTLGLGNRFSELVGKTGINVADAPGFAVNRFFVPWLNEATRLLQEGISIPTIDEISMKVFKIGMGPFLLMNVTGVPIAYHSTISLGRELGNFYLPGQRLREQFESGNDWDLSGDIETKKARIVEERMMATVFYVACNLVEEEVASMEDTDRGAKIGLRWQEGPFGMMNTYGIKRSLEIVEGFVERYSLKIPDILVRQAKKGEPWKFNYVDLNIKGDIATILINRPEAMNAINETVVEQLDAKFKRAESEPDVKAIIIKGAGKAFVAGADIQYFINKIEENKIGDIVDFTRYGHQVLNRIDNSEKLVIAKLDGLALGGGLEMALAADSIVATGKASMGFPETGIGIYPGLGGTQRTSRYIGRELAKYLILTGQTLSAETAMEMGLVEHIFPPGTVDKNIEELVKNGNLATKQKQGGRELSEQLNSIRKMFSGGTLQELLSGKGLNSDDEAMKRMTKRIGFKAPIAVKLANRLIDEGGKVELKEGLEMELDHLSEIFNTRDAYEGLCSVIKRKRPVYRGE